MNKYAIKFVLIKWGKKYKVWKLSEKKIQFHFIQSFFSRKKKITRHRRMRSGRWQAALIIPGISSIFSIRMNFPSISITKRCVGKEKIAFYVEKLNGASFSNLMKLFVFSSKCFFPV
jgi:hypothetical protein